MEKKGKRCLIIVMMISMFILTLGTVIFAEESDSYILTIKKVLAEGSPEEAGNKEYTFKIEGYVLKDKEKVEETVTITGAGEESVSFSEPVKITAIELTDDVLIENADGKWNISDKQMESSMKVPGRTSEISISKDDGKITIERPEDAQTATYFQVTGKDFNSGEEIYKSNPLKIEPGKKLTLKNLKRGNYTVEELKTEGFSIVIDSRTETVMGEEPIGEVYINGNSGKLTIEAPGNPGDPEIYYYVVEQKDSDDKKREIKVNAGESYKLEQLSRGQYSVQEYIYSGNKSYKLTVPQTKTKTKTISVSRKDGENVDNFARCYIIPETVDYAKLKVSINEEVDSYVGVGGYFALNPNELLGLEYPVKYGYYSYAEGEDYNLLPGPVFVQFNSSYNTIDHAILTLTEVETHEVMEDWDNTKGPRTIDERGWMEISKPESGDIAENETSYYYTITDKAGKPITDYTVTDADGKLLSGDAVTNKRDTTVMLKAGQSVRLNGLAKGTYDIKETIQKDTPAAFKIIVENDEQVTQSSNSSCNIIVLGKDKLIIRKPEGHDGGRSYRFSVSGVDSEGNPLTKTIELQAGKSSEGITLEKGEYKVEAVDDADKGFDLTFSDSSTVLVNSTSKATVTFTNTFTKEEGSYHVIHEYYFKNADGSYDYEGSSLLSTVHGKPLDDTKYTYEEVGQEPMYDGREYRPMEQLSYAYAYGTVSMADEEDDGAEEISSTARKVSAGISTPSNAARSDTRKNNSGKQPKKASSSNVSLFEQPLRTFSVQLEKATPGNAVSRYSNNTKDEKSDSNIPEYDEDTGLITKNEGISYDEIHYLYQPNSEMTDGVIATKDGSQIIIKRYYREEKPEVNGSYKVIHVYYLRDKDGDTWEGSSQMDTVDVGKLNDENRKRTYTADNVEKVFCPLNFSVNGEHYEYTYDGSAYGKVRESSNTDIFQGQGNSGEGWTYAADTEMHEVYATEDGDQIIILRYYRTLETKIQASYNVVHEYYYREKKKVSDADNVGGVLGMDEDWREDVNIPSSRIILNDTGKDEGGNGSFFGGTLVNNDEYVYTFEGKTDIENISASLNVHYTKDDVEERKSYTPSGNSEEYQYSYYDVGYGRKVDNEYVCISGKQWAASTEDGNEVIILRYYRETPPPEDPKDPQDEPKDPPDNPENPPEDPKEPSKEPEPTPPGGGGGGGGGRRDPDPTPTPPVPTEPVPEVPSESAPETSPADELPPVLPDPNDPTSPERITIMENGVPRTYVKVWDPVNEEFVYLPEDEVPLAWMDRSPDGELPKTGDSSNLLLCLILVIASFGGMLGLGYIRSRKE